MKKVLSIMYWIILGIGLVLVWLMATIWKFKYAELICIGMILIIVFLRAGIYYLDHKHKEE